MAASTDDIFREAMWSFQSGKLNDAEKSLRKLLRKQPAHPLGLSVLGTILTGLGKYAEAERLLQSALKLNPNAPAALYNHGIALKALGRADEALAQFTQALAISPNDAEAWSNRGTVYNDLKDYQAAIADFDKAIALQPTYALAHHNKGNALFGLARYDEALAAYRQALVLQSNLLESWTGAGLTLHKLKRHDESATAYETARQLNPSYPFLKGILLHQRMLACDWRDIGNLIAEIEGDIAAGKLSAEPFGWQGVATSDQSLQKCAELYNAAKFPADRTAPVARPDNGDRIRIGYLSGEFRAQATSILMTGVLEQHDTSQFEITAFDNGWDDGSDIRKRIKAAVHRIVDLRSLNDAQAARAIRDSGIDILVNLNGYFGDDRTRVFAQRPAPVQVNYLGFPGTLGAAYMDYVLADATVIPDSQRPFFTENVVHLPDSYQANDRTRAIADRVFTRDELGLPPDGVVFCCFNNNYKITPQTFDGWMRILERVPGSVLWLLEDNATASANLRKEAAARSIDPKRLVFAPRMPPDEHLARHRCADLFLDTLPYNAHTTASDALWAGLPLLTCRGDTFAGRVAASLLKTIDLPELVTSSQADYEQRAIELATQPDRLKALRQKLADNRLTTPLFDTVRFTRHLEQAYTAMHARSKARQKPEHIVVPAM
ncbi:putative O-linked N-acetylglucosamine transferase (SPINDLY family) [Afipia massiliensis]|uniref:protein O-GlcNAc transferase n=1 Tax=Afipia massiliensis TaxID=211460 RepID=A0A840N3N9_9BRAD|nr:putative O-linked N-acetylglucosamine transferase (SPINDLY family) [Afipia massiliensis]